MGEMNVLKLRMLLKFLWIVLTVTGCSFAAPNPADRTLRWSGGSFDWPCESTKALYKTHGKYHNKNIIATRSAIHKDQAFVVLPRFKSGVPATLASIPLNCRTGVPSLSAYPCWSLQEEGNCASIQSAVDVFLDLQDILWVLDTGIVNSLEKPVRKCPPKIVAINVKNGNLVKSIDLGGLSTASSRLQYVVTDYSLDGRAFIYVTDAAAGAIIVYDVASGRGYRVLLPKQTTQGCKNRDVLQPILFRRPDGSSCLLFTYLCSNRLFSIRADHLQNGAAQGQIHDLGAKPEDMIFLGTDSGSGVFFRFGGKPDIYRWDATSAFCVANFVKVSSPSDDCALATQVMPDYKRDRMRVLQSNFADFFQGTVGCGTDHSLSIL